MAPRWQVTKYWNGLTATGHKVRALCLDASRCAARRRADLGPFLRSAHWRSLYLTPVVRPFRRYFPGKAEGMATVFAGAALAALAANSALATATSRSSSTPCTSRSVCAVHVGRRLRHACSCGHALPGMLPRAPIHPSVSAGPCGSSRGGESRGGASRGGASRGGASSSVSSSSCERLQRNERGPSEREPSKVGQGEWEPWIERVDWAWIERA